MKILDLELTNFRNLDNLFLKPDENINIISGKNAVGKTNLIEGIYTLIRGKSFRTSKDKEIIKIDKDFSRIESNILNFGYKDNLETIISKNEKNKHFINKEELNLKIYKRDFSAVVFSPLDLNIIKFAPQDRRRYLDDLISKIDPIYEHNLYRYKKILFERNKLLKKNIDFNLLDVYNYQLANYAVKLVRNRVKVIREFEKYAKAHYSNLSQGDLFKITYLSTLSLFESEEEMEKSFIEKLKLFYKKDLELKYTSIGPHRDDLDFKINNLSSKIYASQGEIRSIILALKLSEIDMIKLKLKNEPILILDDVFSELDKKRVNYLIKSINNTQTFITTTNLNEDNFKNINAKNYYMENGKIINIGE